MNNELSNGFRLRDWEVRPLRNLLVGPGGERRIEPKAMQVLVALARQSGEVATRETLLDEVWPDTYSGEVSLTRCISRLRSCFSDGRGNSQFIETIPKTGYRLVPTVEPLAVEKSPAAEEVSPASRSRMRFVIGSASAILVVGALLAAMALKPGGIRDRLTGEAVEPIASIAVLRFTDLSPARNQAYLADGLGEEIIHMLAQSPSLRVIARTSSFAVEGQPIAMIARELDVSHVLEGSVRRQGNEIRVTAQLIDVATDSHIWSRTYDRDIDDIFDVQREIASAVASTLEVSLVDMDAESDIDPRAYALFLEGRFFYRRRADGDRVKAQERFEEALSISPEFARAWAGLAAAAQVRLHDTQHAELGSGERGQVLDTQRHAVEQALRFGPNLPEAHYRAAMYYYNNNERERARKHIEIARSIDPDHWLSRVAVANELRYQGRIEESISMLRQEIQKDPLNMVERENIVGFLIMAQLFEDARAELDKIFEMMPSLADRNQSLVLELSLLQILTGDFKAATISAESLPQSIRRSQLLALAHFALGHQAESDAALTQLEAAVTDDWATLLAAEVYAYRHASMQALDRLRRIDFGTECSFAGKRLAQSVYYSPLLVELDGVPAWAEFRAGALEYMKRCAFGLAVDE